jgi:Domain of unknown function (DUF4307)
VTDSAQRLEQRYPKSRIPTPVAVAVVGVLGAAALGWLIWTASVHSTPAVSAQVASFTVVSDTRVDVTMTVDRPDPSLPVRCLLVAQATDFDRVAEQQVRVAPAENRLVDVKVSLTTLRRATSASVRNCEATG